MALSLRLDATLQLASKMEHATLRLRQEQLCALDTQNTAGKKAVASLASRHSFDSRGPLKQVCTLQHKVEIESFGSDCWRHLRPSIVAVQDVHLHGLKAGSRGHFLNEPKGRPCARAKLAGCVK